MTIRLPIISPVYNSLKQLWEARKFVTNPLLTFMFFLKPSILGRDFLCRFKLEEMHISARSVDWVGINEVMINREYDNVLQTLKKLEHPVVCDLGANIGAFSIQAFYHNRTARVYALEPSLSTWRVLEKNRQENPSLDWRIFRYAVWNYSGEVGFDDNPLASTASHLDQTVTENTVSSIRLDEFIYRFAELPVDILKMDIEGAEERVLLDSPDLLDKIKILIVEIHPYRCDEAKVRTLLSEKFLHIYESLDRQSMKPLLVCSKTELDLKNAKVVK